MSNTQKKVIERKNIYILVAILLVLVIGVAMLFTKMPVEDVTKRDGAIKTVANSLKSFTDEVPEGAELVGGVLIDVNNDGYYEAFREYKNGDRYIVKLYFVNDALEVTAAGYDLIDDLETQECLVAADTFTYQPMVFIKETTSDGIVYKNLNLTKEGKNVGFYFGEKIQDGVKTYFYCEEKLNEEQYTYQFRIYNLAHFSEVDTVLMPESYNML